MKRWMCVVLLQVGCGLFAVTPARADAVIDWNVNALNAIVTVGKKAPIASGIDLTIVQAAVYNAVNAVDGRRHEPYMRSPFAAPGASMDAAAAQAAHDVLVWLYPAQATDLDAQLAASLALVSDGTPKDDGIATGTQAAAEMIALRTNDGRNAPGDYPGGTEPGQWRPTPTLFLPAQTPWVQFVKPFTMTSPSQFRPGGPPPLTSERYARDLNEVKERGAKIGSNRTPDETDQALFFADHAVVQSNRYYRRLAAEQGLSEADEARLFAEANMAGADAGIACFDGKYHFGFWRPITSIPLADTDDNPETVADPAWLSLLATPNHPEYPSAHACYSKATTLTLAAFFGTDHITNTMDSTTTGTSHTFARFSDLYRFVDGARILGGLHYRFSMVDGRRMGRQVSLQLVRHFFRPRHHPHASH